MNGAGAALMRRWQRLQEEKRRGTFVLFVPALCLFFIMGFTTSPFNNPVQRLEPHPVHISLLHGMGAQDAGGGQNQDEQPQTGGPKKHCKHHHTVQPMIAKAAPEAAPTAMQAAAVDISPPAADKGAAGNAAAGNSGEGGGHGGGVGAGLGFGNGAGVQGEGSHDLSQPPEPTAKEWGCDWPWFTKVKDATVTVRVSVNKLGRAYDVEIVGSSDHDFDGVAATCAVHAHYRPGTDKDGHPQKMDTRDLPIHFIKYVAGEK